MATPRPHRRVPGPPNSPPTSPDDDSRVSSVGRHKLNSSSLNDLLSNTNMAATTSASFSRTDGNAAIDGEKQKADIKRLEDQDDIFGFLHTDNSRREDHDDGVVHELDELRRPEGAVYPPLMVGSNAPYWRIRSIREGDVEAMENERRTRVDEEKKMLKVQGPRWWTTFPWKQTQQYIGVVVILWLVIQGPPYLSKNAGKIGGFFKYLGETPSERPATTVPEWVDRKYKFILPENEAALAIQHWIFNEGNEGEGEDEVRVEACGWVDGESGIVEAGIGGVYARAGIGARGEQEGVSKADAGEAAIGEQERRSLEAMRTWMECEASGRGEGVDGDLDKERGLGETEGNGDWDGDHTDLEEEEEDDDDDDDDDDNAESD